MEQQIINDNFLNLFRELIHDKLGIYISKDKDYLLQSKIGRLITRSKYKSIAEFYYQLKNGDKDSLEELIYYITTTHTFFFRENMHLKILRNDILIKKNPFTYIWCAASSTGEEVYSIIIELLEHGITDFLIIASDINKNALMTLKLGRYKIERMKNIQADLLRKYFIQDKENPDLYTVKDFVKKYFIVKKLNLVNNIKFEKKFNYIFCRNVLIYFNKDTQMEVIENLLNNLDESGYLFVGHSESLLNLSNRVETVFSSVYSRKN